MTNHFYKLSENAKLIASQEQDNNFQRGQPIKRRVIVVCESKALRHYSY